MDSVQRIFYVVYLTWSTDYGRIRRSEKMELLCVFLWWKKSFCLHWLSKGIQFERFVNINKVKVFFVTTKI